MRGVLAAALLVSLAVVAFAAPMDRHEIPPPPETPQASDSPQVPAVAPSSHHGAPSGSWNPSRGRGQAGMGGGRHDRPGSRSEGSRHGHGEHGGGVIFFPYPTIPPVWPYPPYTYPYPDDWDDDVPGGPAVPADLPAVTAAFWYYCDAPDGYYPYVKSCPRNWTPIPISPPPPGAAPPISYSDWQWCEETKSFFPYVSSCRSGFVSVHVTAPGADNAGPPSIANWYFCEDPKGYSPYVIQCKRDWRAVPSVPPPSVPVTVRTDAGK